jgi:hypothetical protein
LFDACPPALAADLLLAVAALEVPLPLCMPLLRCVCVSVVRVPPASLPMCSCISFCMFTRCPVIDVILVCSAVRRGRWRASLETVYCE